MDWKTSAFLFPGQGSQAVGMGADFARTFALARETFEQADEFLGFDLSRICFEGPSEALNQTDITQPALYVCSIAIWRALQECLPAARPAWLAGHSLGEFSALTAADALSFEAGLRLVEARGRLMRRAGAENPGAMAAILALDIAEVEALCSAVSAETGQVVVLANDNCPGQAVVSGNIAAVDRLIERASAAGARRAVKLSVSVAAHSPLMASALAGFHDAVQRAAFSPPAAPVYGNVLAKPLESAADIQIELDQQLTRSVRWTESMRAIIAAGAQTFIEIGSGNVLAGLMRRIDRSKARVSLNSVRSLETFLESLA
ncbi:MAG: ACP S-malonyltransferase [Chloroflexota bacterium]|nr:ACP S-malonyltransferase [Chloroflexota bacterium]MDE2911093.1 ACP S-malonyltransferase [Chloroflexota bacterium]